MALNIILGQSGSGKSTYLYSKIRDEAGTDLKKNYIYVVPEQFSIKTIRDLASIMKGQGILNVDVLSFSRFAHRIFDETGNKSRIILDDTGKNLILRGVIKEVEEELKVLTRARNNPGYVSELKSIISEFIQYDISLEDVGKMAEAASVKGYLSAKLEDMGVVYKAFKEKLGEEYITGEELLDNALRQMDEAGFIKGADVFFDGFTGFTPIQYRFIAGLMKNCANIYVALDYDGINGDFFKLSIDTREKLGEIAGSLGVNINTVRLFENENPRLKGRADLLHLEKNLFRKKKESFKGIPDNIEIISCEDPRDEVRLVMSEVIRELTENNVRYEEMGIIVSDTEVYGRLIEEEADRFEIPVFIDATRPIRLNPLIEFIRASLAVLSSDFAYEAVFHYLKSGLSSIERSESDKLENYVRAKGIRGKKRYSRKWGRPSRGQTEEELEEINEIRKRLLSELKPLEMLEGEHKAGEYCSLLFDFLDGFGVAEKLEERSEIFRKNSDTVRADEYSQIYDKLIYLKDQITSLVGDEAVTIEEFTEMLDSGMEEIRIGSIPPSVGVIMAGDMTRSRLDNIKHLFFIGVNEGKVPGENSSAGLLSDMDRQFLSSSFTLSPTTLEKADTEKLYFYMILTKPKERLTLTFSKADEDGKALRVSYFVTALMRLFPDLCINEISTELFSDRLDSRYDLISSVIDKVKKREDPDPDIVGLINENNDSDAVVRLKKAVFKKEATDALSSAVVNVLYGNNKPVSPSRLERFSECAYEHFLMYGMKLREREEYSFEKRDFGTLIHGVLEVLSKVLNGRKMTFSDVDESNREELIKVATEVFLEENKDSAVEDSERSRYFLVRLKKIMNRTIKTLAYQEKSGKYKPDLFEAPFFIDNITGRIDRVDIAEDKSIMYVSVIDYKSGNKSFDINRVYNGIDLQLFIYLYGAVANERKKHPGKDIKAGGVFYYHIDDPYVDEDELADLNPETIEEKINDQLTLRGIVNADPAVVALFDKKVEESGKSNVVKVKVKKDGGYDAHSAVLTEKDIKALGDRVSELSKSYYRRMYEGEISRNPYVYQDMTPCDYCRFSDCCSENEKREATEKRRIRRVSMDEIIEELNKKGE
ncbi:MAG: PD-(D/E)XK nuclease family protein [Lachnospiraceae bacterium]|nr:PD-(D/E)XK nuclease family protein [Lachnospiraceae bacterium]